MLRQEPDLKFIGPNHLTHQQIVCPVVACLRRLPSCRTGRPQNKFVRLEQTRDLDWSLLSTTRRTRNKRCLGSVNTHRETDSTQSLNALREGIHQVRLLAVVRVEQ